MADDSELEKRAVEELLRETSRARVRAETMGPTGWMKCPLRGTNKRFLLNTLRSTGLHHGNNTGENSTTRGRPAGSESCPRHRSRSRTPPRDHKRNGDHRGGGHKSHSNNHNDKRPDRDMQDARDRHKDGGSRDQRHRKGDRKEDDEKFRFQSKDHSPPREGHTSSVNQSLPKE